MFNFRRQMRSITKFLLPSVGAVEVPPPPTPRGSEIVAVDHEERRRRVFDFQQDVENAVLRLDKESRTILDQHEQAIDDLKKALREAGIYKWIARATVLLLFGSAIGFFWKFDDFVDNRISTRVIKSDRLSLALAQAQFGKWRDALAILDEIRIDAEQEKANIDEPFREFLYSNMVWVLANMEDIEPDGSWVGKTQYDALIKDRNFVNMMVRLGTTRDPVWNQSLAMCILKYDGQANAVTRAQAYLDHAVTHMEPIQNRADLHWNLAMLHLSLGAREAARQHLIKASSLHPYLYHINDMQKYENSFLRSPEFQMWDRISRRVGDLDFASEFHQLAQELSRFDEQVQNTPQVLEGT